MSSVSFHPIVLICIYSCKPPYGLQTNLFPALVCRPDNCTDFSLSRNQKSWFGCSEGQSRAWRFLKAALNTPDNEQSQQFLTSSLPPPLTILLEQPLIWPCIHFIVCYKGRRILSILGTNFESHDNGSSVLIGEAKCELLEWTNENITCLLPTLPPAEYNVHVRVGNQGYPLTRSHITFCTL